MTIGFLAAASPNAAAAAGPSLVLGRANAGEFQPVRGSGFLAWQQNTQAHPGHYDVFARPVAGGPEFRVNADGTNGANGGIDGDRLVYQQFSGKQSDLVFYDLGDRHRSFPPTGVNTNQWEYWPSISGSSLLYGRLQGTTRKIVLFDLQTGTSSTLDRVSGDSSFLAPGQANGDWAVWYKCTFQTLCNIIRYHIPDGARSVIPNSGRYQRSPSVGPDGTVYFVRSGGGCGNRVQLFRYPPGGPAKLVLSIPKGKDIASTFLYSNARESALYYELDACGHPAGANVWRLARPVAGAEVTVALGGDGSGTVTSDPAGIDCGTDCSEHYVPGTQVTLTAAPDGVSAFSEWTGECTGTSPTCTVTIEKATSVTAMFRAKPLLTVTKEGDGSGTVTSDPAGIDCGGDCIEPYDPGTQVTLTAQPGQFSVFMGWSVPGCSGTVTTCSVTMDASKTVTARFDSPVNP